ncbi:MAG: hypothetical protein KJ941_00870 [Bacteroidetes bacterium]|nr:hypothetical protein [Bacteroidota bacterium]
MLKHTTFWSKIIASGLIILAVTWVVYNTFKSNISDDFEYTAQIKSVDNFYDSSKSEFTGQILSNTLFSYRVIEKKDKGLIIEKYF